MPTDDCHGPVGYSMNFMGEAFSLEQNKLTLTCSDNDTYEVEVWAFDKANNPYALQPNGSVGGRNSERCVTLITVTNADACLAGLAGADKDDEEKGVGCC